ncbi:hypothetical protein COB57_05085 [Candidatus Peregrinibacteria bacterium]|nr:MAG: hypothetical protein COB57_05085 [Candidatus Peregrinibacteria bacterium]
MTKIHVQGIEINISSKNNNNYISLTDIISAKNGNFFISDWLRNRNTIEFIGIWGKLNNPNFNYGEFAIIKSQAGLNNYKLSIKEWTTKTNAIGLRAIAEKHTVIIIRFKEIFSILKNSFFSFSFLFTLST